MAKAVVFDIGGVLIPDHSLLIFEDIHRRIGGSDRALLNILARHHRRVTCGEETLAGMYQSVVEEEGLDIDPNELFLDHIRVYEEIVNTKDEGVIAIIDKLRQDHVIAAMTDTEPEIAEINRENGLFSLFDRVFLSIEMGFSKPDPRAFEKVIEGLGLPPENISFIDDKAPNVSAAKDSGMKAILFTGAQSLMAELGRIM